jgi:IS605 OrfB family transposase
MQIITRKTKLIFKSEEDKQSIIQMLETARDVFNFCAAEQYGAPRNNIIDLHAKCYKRARVLFPKCKSAIIVQVENHVLSAYRSIKSNNHKIDKAIVKKRLSLSLNATMCSYKNDEFSLLSLGKRVKAKLTVYPLLSEYLEKYKFGDVTVFVENGDVYISLPFKVECAEVKPKLALGVDLGIRRFAATSDGQLFIDKKFNKRKRKLRHLKNKLKRKGTRSAKRHLKKIGHKERNQNTNFTHHLANAILNTPANAIVLEELDVKKLKSKKHKYQNKNRICQVGFSNLLLFLTYKAHLKNKLVITVNPAYTSQIDCLTGRKDGERKGCRYYSKKGLVYDADINAAINIAKLSKLPILQGNLLDGQAFVNTPIVGKVLTSPLALALGS